MELLNIHHGFNFRDLGGYQTQSGQTLRHHKIVRSGRLNDLSARDSQFLADYGVKYDVDFRSAKEAQDAPDRVPNGASYHFDPVFATDETKASIKAEELRRQAFAKDPLGGFHNMVATYTDIVLQKNAQQAYRQFFDLLLENTDGALLFHCTAGKDRTGMGAVYFLTALGVPAATVRQDYLASNLYLGQETARMVNAAKLAGGSPEMIASTRSLCGVANEYLDSALLTIDKEFGSVDDYLTQVLDVTPAQRADLRRIYLH